MQTIKNAVEKHRKLIYDAEQFIGKHPETGYREWETSKYLAEQYEKLGEKHIMEYQLALPDGRICARFCTAWSTAGADVDELIADIGAL